MVIVFLYSSFLLVFIKYGDKMKPTTYTTRRKIQHVELSAYISLPIFWIRQNNFKKGDAVKITLLDDGGLYIGSNKANQTT